MGMDRWLLPYLGSCQRRCPFLFLLPILNQKRATHDTPNHITS